MSPSWASRLAESASVASTRAIERLSTGLRINQASDDAGSVALWQSSQAHTRGLAQALRNAQDGIAYMRTADAAFSVTSAALQRMRELAVQAANGSQSSASRQVLHQEFTAMRDEAVKTMQRAHFNGHAIFDGLTTPIKFHVTAGNGPTIDAPTASAALVGIYLAFLGTSLTTAGGAQAAIGATDGAIGAFSALRADYGATENRLMFVADALSNGYEYAAAAASRLGDADMAAEAVAFVRAQALTQVGFAAVRAAGLDEVRSATLLLDIPRISPKSKPAQTAPPQSPQ